MLVCAVYGVDTSLEIYVENTAFSVNYSPIWPSLDAKLEKAGKIFRAH